jgi:hypothetical protein
MKHLAVLAALFWICSAHAQTSGAPGAADAADVNQAITYVKDALNDFTHCRRASACSAYFDTFGVAIPFADGSIAPFAHLQRLNASSRDCIKMARTLLDHGDRTLAVQWTMAARIENARVRDWLGSHPDAVVEALRRCCW